MALHKDEILDRLARRGNVAQFVAYRPGAGGTAEQSFSRVAGQDANTPLGDLRHAVELLLAASGEGKVNVRSYLPDDPRSREFVYGLDSAEVATATVLRLSDEGLHTIVNETIDVSDGGVSGVMLGDTMEFSPDDTPRCVERPGVASLPFAAGMQILTTVYGFSPELESRAGERTEFSIHPRVRGWRRGHTLLWERESGAGSAPPPSQRWPNRFSQHVGDKAFGLLMADRIGVPVPRTIAIPRRVAPFEFGRATGSTEIWTRTCPAEPHPGLYTTVKGWTDPFDLLSREDPDGHVLASVLRQDAIPAGHSGAAITAADGTLAIEGRRGEGDRLMLGLERPETLPGAVVEEVRAVHRRLAAALGPVRFEWVHDGVRAWIVQLHVGATESVGTVLVPGEAATWIDVPTDQGLEALRAALAASPDGSGVLLIGEVGLTSHIADLARRRGLPARIVART